MQNLRLRGRPLPIIFARIVSTMIMTMLTIRDELLVALITKISRSNFDGIACDFTYLLSHLQ